jgi:cytochrome c-type biogenesis protein CcmH
MRQQIAQRRAQFLVLSVVILMAALWSAMYIHSASQKTLDQRVQDVASQLECPICQNESVASSPSLLAQQMRMVIRQQLQSGKSEQEVVQYFAHSYGDQIVGTPPWQGFSLLAWLVPIALLLGGAVLLWFTLRDWSTHVPPSVPATKRTARAGEHADPAQIDDAELEQYRVQLEWELAEEDPLFARPGMEGQF